LTEKSPARRFFAVKADVANAFNQMASNRNLTLYGIVSDILEKIVSLDTMGGSLDEAIDYFRLCKTSREIGFIPIPENLWYHAVELSAKMDEGGTRARFEDVGEWIGKYALTKSEGKDSVTYLKTCLAPLASDASEFWLEGHESIILRCVNSHHSQLYARLFSVLLTKAVETLGYDLEDQTVSQGLILLSFRKIPVIKDRHMGGELRLEALGKTSA
jgi:hypothetical protein